MLLPLHLLTERRFQVNNEKKAPVLTLEHLAPYITYGIRAIVGETERNITAVSVDSPFVFVSAWKGSREKEMVSIEDIKPILRPLSDLTKEIEHNGERFIPIIELYKKSSEYYNSKDLDYEFIDSWGAKGNILKVYHNRDKDEYSEFVYSNLSFRKDTRFEKGSYNFGMYLPHPIRVDDKIHNIYFLQKLLFKWHFDVFGLIEKGLAIDINSIEGKENPNES